jgi:hypothetical protein
MRDNRIFCSQADPDAVSADEHPSGGGGWAAREQRLGTINAMARISRVRTWVSTDISSAPLTTCVFPIVDERRHIDRVLGVAIRRVSSFRVI